MFYENLNPGIFGKVLATRWHQLGGTKLEVISTADIRRFAERVFNETQKHGGEPISLIGAQSSFWVVIKTYNEIVSQWILETSGLR